MSLTGNISLGGDTYNFDILNCPWSLRLYCQYRVSLTVFVREKEVSRLLQQTAHGLRVKLSD